MTEQQRKLTQRMDHLEIKWAYLAQQHDDVTRSLRILRRVFGALTIILFLDLFI